MDYATIHKDNCIYIRNLNEMKAAKKGLFGDAFLLSEKAAADCGNIHTLSTTLAVLLSLLPPPNKSHHQSATSFTPAHRATLGNKASIHRCPSF